MHTTAPPLGPEEEVAVMAAADLAERAGAKGFRIGYTPTTPVTWFAVAEYGGQAEIAVRGHPNPAAAATALATRLLTGAKCKCGGLVALSVSGAWAPGDSATMLDGVRPVAAPRRPPVPVDIGRGPVDPRLRRPADQAQRHRPGIVAAAPRRVNPPRPALIVERCPAGAAQT